MWCQGSALVVPLAVTFAAAPPPVLLALLPTSSLLPTIVALVLRDASPARSVSEAGTPVPSADPTTTWTQGAAENVWHLA